MGFQKASSSPNPQRAASPPSGAANKSRRPSSLSVASSSSKTSPSRPSPARSPVPKRNGSVTKASTPPGKPLTCAQGPVLATEARSKVRPCGCSRRHGAGHHHPQETPKESPRRKSKNEATMKGSSPPPTKSEHKTFTPVTAKSDKEGIINRYVSTLVWVPKMTPFTYSTTLVVSARDPAFSEVICIKQGTACPDNFSEARKH